MRSEYRQVVEGMIVTVKWQLSRLNDDLLIQLLNVPRPYVLCDVFADLKQLKNVYHSLLLRKKMASRQCDCTCVFEENLGA